MVCLWLHINGENFTGLNDFSTTLGNDDLYLDFWTTYEHQIKFIKAPTFVSNNMKKKTKKPNIEFILKTFLKMIVSECITFWVTICNYVGIIMYREFSDYFAKQMNLQETFGHKVTNIYLGMINPLCSAEKYLLSYLPGFSLNCLKT